MFVAGGTGLVVAWIAGGAIFCTVTTRLSGADIALAAHVVVAGCAFGFVLSIPVRARPLLLSLTLLLTACVLLAGIVLVAHDSAASSAVESCTLISTTRETVTDHFLYVYVLWGVPSAVLLLQAGRVWVNQRGTAIASS